MNTHDDLETIAPPTDVPAQAGTAAAAGSALAATLALAACGGGEDGDEAPTDAAAAGRIQPQVMTQMNAFRLLTQATFGPTTAAVNDLAANHTADSWITAQFAIPANATHHTARWKEAYNWPANEVGQCPLDVIPAYSPITSSFYERALTANDQLRQRVAFALSEIFVVSAVDLTGQISLAIASFLDMLNQHAFGNFKDLLRAVTKHPAMGIYLSTVNNKKENLATGRIPDQNYAREVMQLFSIGLVELEMNGQPKSPLTPTYDQEDIVGLSRVFTGFKMQTYLDCEGEEKPYRDREMVFYEPAHSHYEKKFLDELIPAIPGGGLTDPAGDLEIAIDALTEHPNTGPFIARQLIQRLVTSHPSPEYVAAVAQQFVGPNWNLKPLIRKVLNHAEARGAQAPTSPSFGKLREPVLRLTALLRANGATSTSGKFKMDNSDDPATELGQTPMRSASVFNFFRPGFIPVHGNAATHNLTVPEMQTTTEVSVAGHLNFMIDTLEFGLGVVPTGGSTRDIQINITPLKADAANATTLASKVIDMLVGPGTSGLAKNAFLRVKLEAAVNSITVPGTNPDPALTARVRIALAMVLASPEFIVQR